VIALACDLNFVTACVAAGVAAILLAWRNLAAAWDVGTLEFLSIFHSHFLHFGLAGLPADRPSSVARFECMQVSKCCKLLTA
jgi:hypothetical protein